MDYLKIQKKILEKIHKNPYRNIYVDKKLAGCVLPVKLSE